MGNGFHEKEYEKLVKTLTICADEWEDRTSIPGEVLQTLIELYDELYNFSLIYGDEESIRIKKAAENTKKLIQRCTKEVGEIEPEKARVIARLIEKINENGKETFFKNFKMAKEWTNNNLKEFIMSYLKLSTRFIRGETFQKYW